jgi:hypothetical protein
MRGAIHFIEKNIYGAWVVYGIIGVKQYYYYTKKQAEQLYREQANRIVFVNQ